MSTEVASAHVAITASAAGFTKELDEAKNATIGSVGIISKYLGSINLGGLLGLGGLAAIMGKFVTEAINSESAIARFDFSLSRMAEHTGYTSDQIRGMTDELKNLGVGGGGARDVLGTLMQFQSLRGDNFHNAAMAVGEFAGAGMDAAQVAQSLGRALEYPANSTRTLRQLHIYLPQDMQNSIRTMTQMGQTAQAQAIILAEVNRQSQGLAATMRATTGGQLALLEREVKSIGKSIGEAILPPLLFLAETTVSVIRTLKEGWDALPSPIREVAKAGMLAAGAFTAYSHISPLFKTLASAFAPLKDGLMAIYSAGAKVGAMLGELVAKTAVYLFYSVGGMLASAASWAVTTGAVLIYKGVLSLVSAGMMTFAGVMALVKLGLGLYTGSISITTIVTKIWGIITAIASGGISILTGVLVVCAGVLIGVFAVALAAVIAPFVVLGAAITAVIAAVGGLAAIAGVGYLVTYVAAMVSAFRDPELGKPMKENLMAVWGVVKQIGQALLAGFGSLGGMASGWNDMRIAAQQFFLAITGWIRENRDTFVAWGYYIGQIARAAFDIVVAAWNWCVGLISRGLGLVVDQNRLSWSAIAGFITTTLSYVSVLANNMRLAWDIVVAGFQYAWATITTGATWSSWWITAKIYFEDAKNFVINAFYTAWTAIRIAFVNMLPHIKAAFLDMMAGLVRGLASGPWAELVGMQGALRDQARSLTLDASLARSSSGADQTAARAEAQRIQREANEATRIRAKEATAERKRLQQQLNVANVAAETPEVAARRAALQAQIARLDALVAANRNQMTAATSALGGGSGPAPSPPAQAVPVEFKSSGLEAMWKTMQEDQGTSMAALLAEGNQLQQMQYGTAQDTNGILREMLARLAGGVPAVAQ